MKVTSSELQKTFMECVIKMAGAIGINCSITTDAGTHSFDMETGKVTESDKYQTVITGQMTFDFSDLMQDIVTEPKRSVEELTFRDLYGRLNRQTWEDSSFVYIGDDAEQYNPRFNNWYIEVKKLDHQTLIVNLHAKQNNDPSKITFMCSIMLNHLMDTCEISYSPAPIQYPVNHVEHKFSMKTKLIDTDEWGMKFHDNEIMEKLKDKLISLAED